MVRFHFVHFLAISVWFPEGPKMEKVVQYLPPGLKMSSKNEISSEPPTKALSQGWEVQRVKFKISSELEVFQARLKGLGGSRAECRK